MTSILGRIFRNGNTQPPAIDRGDAAYAQVMSDTTELVDRMRAASRTTDAARSVIADIWMRAQNVPFMATVYEAVQEAKSGPESIRLNGKGRH